VHPHREHLHSTGIRKFFRSRQSPRKGKSIRKWTTSWRQRLNLGKSSELIEEGCPKRPDHSRPSSRNASRSLPEQGLFGGVKSGRIKTIRDFADLFNRTQEGMLFGREVRSQFR
jgi:hypothetical protein